MVDEVDGGNQDIEAGLDKIGAPPKGNSALYQPMYQERGVRVPVSKHLGKFWKSRKDHGLSARADLESAWQEAVAYYELDHSRAADVIRKQSTDGKLRRGRNALTIGDQLLETENHVFTNVSALGTMLYMRNPDISFQDTALSQDNSPMAEACEELAKVLTTKRTAPGINLMVKMRKAITQTQLRNSSYIVTGYNRPEDGVDSLRGEIQKIEDEWQKARSVKEIEKLEGRLNALMEQVAVADPAGPWVRVFRADQVVVDPEAENDDLSDAKWIMYYTFMSTDTVKARFGTPKKDEDGNSSYGQLYKPTHVLAVDAKGSRSEDGAFDGESLHMLTEKVDYSSYGYSDAETFKRAQMTKVWYVWDRTMRRVYLFNDGDWTWPLWVWQDPYELPDFFPIHRLYFHIHPDCIETVGEVSYYLDQQDAINIILSEQTRMREWARKNVFYDKNSATKEDVEAVLKGPNGTARGLDVPEGRRLEDILPRSAPPPSINYPDLFDPNSRREAISRLSGTDAALRGEQYRTNTTNDAVQRYEATSNARIDMRTDRIEEVVARVCRDLMFMCARFMDQQQLTTLIGPERAANFPLGAMPAELEQMYNFKITVGSMQKPTSMIKKREALELGQVLGQFAKGAPVAIKVLLQVFERAFDEVVISDQDWAEIRGFMEQQLGGAPGGGGGAPGGANPQQILQVIDSLPPQAKMALGQALAKGVPAAQALERIMQLAQGGGAGGSPGPSDATQGGATVQ